MNISYNWLKRYLKTDLSAEEMATILTDIGLEVESFEKIESIRGGLAGVVVGEVLTCTDHPDSDHLHLTTVDVGGEAPLQIVGSMGWTDIDYSFAFQNLIIMHETMGVLPLEALSDGTRSVISMAADLAYRMVRRNPDLGAMAALETPGIVLIDEVDMHLHPSWQQAVVYDVRKAFPNVQFIVTTHSPQVLSTVPAEAIRILRWDNNLINIDKPAFSLGAESFQLLKDIQNVDTRPQALPIVKDLYRYLMLVSEDKWDTDEARELRKRLDEWSKGCEPALVRADTEIRMKSFRRKKK